MKKEIVKPLFVILILSLHCIVYGQTNLPKLYINELMASNSSTVLSRDFDEYSDWIEIHNAEDSSVAIGGYYLTDDLSDPQKWRIPDDTRIYQGKRALFWADGRNEGRHTNFKLSASGEEIGLFASNGELVDSIRFTTQVADISYGRFPDGSDTLVFFDQPTPGTSNKNPGYAGILQPPSFSQPGGRYENALPIELLPNDSEDTIRYTFNGSQPDEQSPAYITPIIHDTTTVIRARSFRKGYIPSPVITRTYFLHESTTLPIVSVVTNPENLWDNEIGIYVEGTNGIPGYCSSEPKNWNQQWERKINLEMFESNGNPAFNIEAGMQIGGGCTRKYPQKTLAIYVRSEYGTSKINYPIFRDKAINSYNNILLRNNGQDWWRGMFRDGLMHTIVKDKMDIDWQAYKPAVLFLNGDYWGIHGIREKHNEHYLAANYGIDPDAIDILSGSGAVKQGSSTLYDNMIDYIETHDLANDEYYQWVQTQMDIDEYINYIIAEVYFANIDWPGGNIKFWRQHGENHKWRWILFDTDLGFGAHDLGQYDSNSLENATSPIKTYYANPTWSTFLLRNLLENEGFRDRFIQCFASHINITFDPSRVLGIIDSLKNNIEAEIPRHIQKWPESTSFNDGWAYHVNVMKEFATLRPGFVLEHLSDKFGLSDTTRLHIHNNDITMGSICVNGVEVPSEDFEGIYFMDIPLECKALAKPGYEFVGWQGDVQSADETIEIVLDSESNLEAVFRVDASSEYCGLRINEIMAQNARGETDEHGDFEDWIEIYNESPNAIDIGGMYLTDNLQEPAKWQIPQSNPDLTTIPAGGYLLLWADEETDQGVLHLDLKLSAGGEEVGLAKDTDRGLQIVDSLSFGSQTADVSYGRSPDGSDDLAFFTSPTPGFSNGSDINDDVTFPKEYALGQNYPNPFNQATTIRYELFSNGYVSLTIHDITGKKISSLFDGYRTRGYYEINWNASRLSSGIYFYRLIAGDFVETKKMILMK